MKIGILQCDSVMDEFQNQFGNYPQMFIDLIKRLEPEITIEIYNVELGQYPMTHGDCDAYITTGSKASVYDDLPWLVEFKIFIQQLKEKKIKLAAICFCHQLIADIFGGKTENSAKGWGVGVSKNRIIKQQVWMQPALETLHIIVSHQDQVTHLPKGADLLASSDFCPNYLYQLGDSIISIQGHPEFSKDYSAALMTHRRDKLGEKTLQHGLNSLTLDTHELIFMQWILNFFKPSLSRTKEQYD